MSAVTAVALLFLLSGDPADAQPEQSELVKCCPVLTNAEAAAVLGSDTLFVSGVEATSGSVRISLLCEFVQGDRTLTVLAGKTLGTKDTWETMRKLSNGTIEQAMGDYAYSELEEGKAHSLS